jgi:hypothetical protein
MDSESRIGILWVIVIAFVAYHLGQKSRANGRRRGVAQTIGDTVAEYTDGGAPIMGPVGALPTGYGNTGVMPPQMGAAPPAVVVDPNVINPY